MRATRPFVIAVLMSCASVAGAQVAESTAPARVPRRMQRGAQQQLPRAAPNEQQVLRQRVRQAFAGVVRKQLNLNPVQMQTLQRTDQKYEQQRRAVVLSEREARLGLKAAMEDSTGHPDQDKIAQYLDQLVQGQRRRADLLEGEQKELAGFLSPLQRAQYFALKERLNRKMQELQADSLTGRGGRGIVTPPQP
jgi:hypothetical protein